MKTFFTIILCQFLGSTLFACSCKEPPPAIVRGETSTAVFVGRVSAEELRGEYRFYTIRVIEMLKGDLPKQVVIKTDSDGASCGSRFSKDVDYLIFCRGDLPDKLTTNLCAGNRVASSEIGKAEIAELKGTE